MVRTISNATQAAPLGGDEKIPAMQDGAPVHVTPDQIKTYVTPTDAEIFAAVLNEDGPSSGLDADTVDGHHAESFALVGHRHDALYQPLDSTLTALAGSNPTAFGLSLIEAANAAALKALADLETGIDVQAHSSTLDTLASLSITALGQALLEAATQQEAQTIIGAGGAGTPAEILAALVTVDGAGSGLDADLLDGQHASAFAAAGHNHSGVYQPLDAELSAIAGLTSAADRLPYFTGSGTASLATFTAFGRSLVDDADAATARSTLGLVIGTDVQAFDADLSALAALAGTGLAVRTAANTWAQRSLAQPAAGITVSNADGVSGNPTLALANDLAALEGLGSTGLAARTGSDTWAQRSIQGTANEVSVANGDGVSGNPTVSLPSSLTFTGKTITGGTFSSPAAITGLPDPTSAQDAATKAYVDSVAAGLDVKPSVKCATTANITLSGTQTIDGVSAGVGDRVLVKNQTTQAQNGIYVVAAGAWSRATDMDAWGEVPGSFVFVEQGSTYADTAWVCTADAGGTLGTTAITWSQFAGAGTYTAGTGLSLTGTQFAISDPELLALAGLTSAADRLPYFTGSGTASLATFTSFGRSLVDDADAATARGTLGLASSTTDNAIVRFDGAAGQTQNSGVTIDDSNNVSGVVALTASGVMQIRGVADPVYPSLGAGFEFAYDTDGSYTGSSGGSGAAIFQSFDRGASAWRDVRFRGNNISFDVNGTAALQLLVGGTAYIPGTIELGHGSDTTIARVSAGRIAVEGSNVLMASDIGSSVQAFGELLNEIAALPTDPNADSGLFFDDSAGSIQYWTPTGALSFSGTNLVAASASESAPGVVELATTTETQTGTDTSRAVTPAGLRAVTREKLSAARTIYVRTPAATVTMSIASPAVVSWTGHGLQANDRVVFSLPKDRQAVTITIASPGVCTASGHGFANDDPVLLQTTGVLPTGLTAGTVYYVRNAAANTFELAASPGGASINTSGSQSGSHRVERMSTLPTGVTEGTAYWVISTGLTANSFQFSASQGGAAVNTSGSQAGRITAATGNDANDGLSNTRTGALLTIQAAADKVRRTLDDGDFDITISLSESTYNEFSGFTNIGSFDRTDNNSIFGGATALERLFITGQNATNSNTKINGGLMFSRSIARVNNIRFEGNTDALIGVNHSKISYQNIHFANTGTGLYLTQSTANALSPNDILSSMFYFMYVGQHSFSRMGSRTLNLWNTPNFSGAFMLAEDSGIIYFTGNTINGSATGARKVAGWLGQVYTFGGPVPGNADDYPTAGGMMDDFTIITLYNFSAAGTPSIYEPGSLIYITDGDAGRPCLGVSDGSEWRLVPFVRAPITITSTTTLTAAAHHRARIDNTGATARVDVTLPAASRGLEVSFVCADADGLRIIAASGDTINVAGTVSAAAGYAESTQVGATVTLYAVDADQWIATSALGTWTVT